MEQLLHNREDTITAESKSKYVCIRKNTENFMVALFDEICHWLQILIYIMSKMQN